MNGFTDKDVDEVLEYWFGGQRPQDNYKTKWFPTGNKELQLNADNAVTAKFAPLLARTLSINPEDYLQNTRFLVAVIIVLDQFSRHIYRSLDPDSPLRKKADAMASSAADMLTRMPAWDQNMAVPEFVFALMPYRHASTIERLNQVMDNIDKRFERENESAELLKKFKKQTVRRLQHLQDRNQATESDDILEYHEFNVEMNLENIMKEPLIISTRRFLEEHSCSDLVISLSGGVDSMVIAKILSLLSRVMPDRKLVAMHIDYANREESCREAAFVEEWATRHGFEVYVRVVDEVTRGVTNRSDYERISRQIRYGFYTEVLYKRGWQGNLTDSGIGVIFGHHIGDIQENVISNIMRGCSPLSLAGMSAVGNTEGVPIWRPLLNHSKQEIYDFSHKYGVPYFKDTTPSWSTRGKLRNQLLPLLVDMYGIGCLKNIATLANESDEARKLIYSSVYKPFLDSVHRYPCGLVVNVLPHRHQPTSFWRDMLKELMHSMSMPMIREKAVLNFVERLQKENCRLNIWVELRKGFHTFLDDAGNLIIFRDKVMQMGVIGGKTAKKIDENVAVSGTSLVESLSLDDSGHDIPIRIGESLQLDSWMITCDLIDSLCSTWNQAQQEYDNVRILCSPLNLMENGSFSYLIPLQDMQSHHTDSSAEFVLRMKRHQSIKRPHIPIPALHGMDSRMRLSLPFLVLSPTTYTVPDPKQSPNCFLRLTYTMTLEYTV